MDKFARGLGILSVAVSLVFLGISLEDYLSLRAQASQAPQSQRHANRGATDDIKDFLPKDAGQMVAGGCMFSGFNDGSEPYAEVQVFLKYSGPPSRAWDFKPILARYTAREGGVFKAIDDCVRWEKAISEAIRHFKPTKPPTKPSGLPTEGDTEHRRDLGLPAQ